MSAKVILADFQFLTRKGIAALIQAIPGMQLVKQVEHEHQLEETITQLSPELAVVDVHGKEDIL
ncbi:MAG: hypothetical protein AAF391_06900, partial [Bacteroidota bacterium]